MSLLVNFHDKCDIKGVTFTFPSEKSHIHLGLGGLGTSWRCMADSQTLGWKVLPSHMDCSWLTTVPVQLKMPEKRPGTKDIFVEWNGLLSGKHGASADYTSMAVWVNILLWFAFIGGCILGISISWVSSESLIFILKNFLIRKIFF